MDAMTFEGPLAGRHVVAGVHASNGGTNNFHFAAQPSPSDPICTVPFRSDPKFVKRPVISAWVESTLASPNHCAALYGLGGVGKSQIAIQYAHGVREDTPGTWVFWVHASSAARFRAAYQDIAERLKLPGRDDPRKSSLDLVYRWLTDEANGPWLMIVDNVEKDDALFSKQPAGLPESERPLESYIPKTGRGCVLVTARSSEVAERLVGEDATFRVPEMHPGQAMELLRGALGEDLFQDGEVARDLLAALDFLPLAIIQAASFIKKRSGRGATMAAYLKDFRQGDDERRTLLTREARGLRRDPSASNAVVTTWQIIFDRIYIERISAAELLMVMSFFNPQDIPVFVLEAYSVQAGGKDLQEDLDVLEEYSLVSATTNYDMLKMHALVQFCTQVWLSAFNDKERWRLKFMQCLSLKYPYGEYETQAVCQRLDPHIPKAIEARPTAKADVEIWASLLDRAAEYRFYNGRPEEAEKMRRRELTGVEEVLGSEHRFTRATMSNLARVLHSVGDFKEAEKLYQRALFMCKKATRHDYSDTLVIMSNLASVFYHLGRHKDSEEMNRALLVGHETMFGQEHPDTLRIINNLAMALQGQGNLVEAENMGWRALKGSERTLDDGHPLKLMSLNNLSSVLLSQGKAEEAEPLSQRALKGMESTYGRQHQNTLQILARLAATMSAQGKHREAEDLYRRSLAGLKKTLGGEHPDTLHSSLSLAVTLTKRGHYVEAEKMHWWTLAGCQKALGCEHPVTILSMSSLAHNCWALGKRSEAKEMLFRACVLLQKLNRDSDHQRIQEMISTLEAWRRSN